MSNVTGYEVGASIAHFRQQCLAVEKARAPYGRCRKHNYPLAILDNCSQCGGDGETYRDADFEGDWLSGWFRCYACGGSGEGVPDCEFCQDEEHDY